MNDPAIRSLIREGIAPPWKVRRQPDAPPGFYENVIPDRLEDFPDDWIYSQPFFDPSIPSPSGNHIAADRLEHRNYPADQLLDPNDPSSRRGSAQIQRFYDPNSQQLILSSAFIRGQPKVIQHPGSLFPNGTPTGTFVTLFQMKQFGIQAGSLQSVKMSTIVNLDTILQLEWLTRHSNKSPNELIQYTHSVGYARRIIELSGHKMKSIEVIQGQGSYSQLSGSGVGSVQYRIEAERYQEIRRYGIDPNDDVFIGFDILIHLEPK